MRIGARLTLFVALIFAGCGSEVTVSPAGRELTAAAAQAIGRRSEDGLKMVAQQLAERRDAGDVSAAEADAVLDLLTTAETGDWESANREVRELLARQRLAAPVRPGLRLD